MIIGDNREAVIENIRTAAESGDFYAKVELNDPVLTKEQSDAIVSGFLKNRKKASFKAKTLAAREIATILTRALNKNTEIIGLEKVAGITGGAIITSNHFSPIENTAIRHLCKKLGKSKINVVSQETNFAMPGIIGFLMNYADTIPLSGDMRYLQRDFLTVLDEKLKKGEDVLIYPEQEMWFNYRKPRPPKRGAYLFAAKLNAPIISCFVELQDLSETDKGDFSKVKFVVHVLDVLRPDPQKKARENSEIMCKADYKMKTDIYEKVYGKKLDYTFENSDIAGWRGSLK